MADDAAVFTSGPLKVDTGPMGLDFERADIVFEGVEQAGPSFEVRVFLNNPSADATTQKTPENGYSGSLHVYGYGLWPPGPEGAPEEQDSRPKAPMTRYIIATEAVREALRTGKDVTVTTVLVPSGGPGSPGKGLGMSLDPSRVRIQVDRPPPGSEEA